MLYIWAEHATIYGNGSYPMQNILRVVLAQSWWFSFKQMGWDDSLQRCVLNRLTHLPLGKMAAVSQTIFSDAFLVNEQFCAFFKRSLKFVSKGPIEINPALVQIMACRNQCWPSSLTHICGTRGRWVNRIIDDSANCIPHTPEKTSVKWKKGSYVYEVSEECNSMFRGLPYVCIDLKFHVVKQCQYFNERFPV